METQGAELLGFARHGSSLNLGACCLELKLLDIPNQPPLATQLFIIDNSYDDNNYRDINYKSNPTSGLLPILRSDWLSY